jgi:hypothetical protein
MIAVLVGSAFSAELAFTANVPQLLALQRRHGETVGQVTRVLEENHGLVEIRYVVAGAIKPAVRQKQSIQHVSRGGCRPHFPRRCMKRVSAQSSEMHATNPIQTGSSQFATDKLTQVNIAIKQHRTPT